jgi:hypothetical protein
VNENAETLKKNFFELTELKHTLQKAQHFFQVIWEGLFFEAKLYSGCVVTFYCPGVVTHDRRIGSLIKWSSLAPQQGCQIFLGPHIPNCEKYSQ